MIKNQNEKMKAVGRGMMKVANQASASKVASNLSWGSGGGANKKASPHSNKVSGITVRGGKAQTTGKTSTGPWGGAKEGYNTNVTRTIGSKSK